MRNTFENTINLLSFFQLYFLLKDCFIVIKLLLKIDRKQETPHSRLQQSANPGRAVPYLKNNSLRKQVFT